MVVTNRAQIEPSNHIKEYRITSDLMAQFVTAKAVWACPETQVCCVPRYFEVKDSGNDGEPKKSFAYMMIALSANILEKQANHAWLSGLIGSSLDGSRIVENVWNLIVKRYKYDSNGLKAYWKSPKMMERINDVYGLTDSDFETLIKSSTPYTTSSKSGNVEWIMFAARADKIIENMLEDPDTNKVPGSLHIVQTVPITKDNVEFICHLYEGEKRVVYNTEIRELLVGK